MSYFNPRSYKRSDKLKSGLYITAAISIHAPTRGATWHSSNVLCFFWIFQSTLLQEERLFSHVIYNLLVKFQSTLLQEERHSPTCYHKFSVTISIHAPTRGATMCKSNIYVNMQFQSTLLQEERRRWQLNRFYPIQFQSTLLQEDRLS